ncbi:hypothetical protein [Pedobacter jejuensis]|nr:hypothetical protein [Pedobacter jejuensis]
MAKDTSPAIADGNFFRLPLRSGTRILTTETLDRYSDFRRPKRPYLRIRCMKLSFHNELLTIGVTLDSEEEEKIYIKVTASELLVSCSVDTTNNFLSRYAYFALYDMMSIYDENDFEDYYWPGFFDGNGESRYLMIRMYRGSLVVFPKVRYNGFYKPEQALPIIGDKISGTRQEVEILKESTPKGTQEILGFCLADTSTERWHTNHYLFLVPYIGILDNNRTFVKGFKKYVLGHGDISAMDVDPIQGKLIDICIEMKKIALVKYPQYRDEKDVADEKRKANRENFAMLLELWHQALPMVAGRLYTHYRFTYGMRNVKGKPSKKDMEPCIISNEVPEICFLWKDRGDYFKLELRFVVGGKMHEVSNFFDTAFFIASSSDPKRFFLLSWVTECELVAFFSKRNFRLLMLKIHYEEHCREFVGKLRDNYRFINR